MATIPSMIMIATTKTSLARAFNEWATRAEESPDDFNGPDDGDYGHACAGYLIELLNER